MKMCHGVISSFGRSKWWVRHFIRCIGFCGGGGVLIKSVDLRACKHKKCSRNNPYVV